MFPLAFCRYAKEYPGLESPPRAQKPFCADLKGSCLPFPSLTLSLSHSLSLCLSVSPSPSPSPSRSHAHTRTHYSGLRTSQSIHTCHSRNSGDLKSGRRLNSSPIHNAEALRKSLGDILRGPGQGISLLGLYLMMNKNKLCLAYPSQLGEKSEEITDEKDLEA